MPLSCARWLNDARINTSACATTALPPTIILVGGSFDPPHLAHIQLPIFVRSTLAAQSIVPPNTLLLFTPAARSPHKDKSPNVSDTHRVSMLTQVVSPIENASVWTDEIDRAQASTSPSYTIDSLTRLTELLKHEKLANAKLRLLLGVDQALAFHRWHQPLEILKLAEPIIIARGLISTSDMLTTALAKMNFWSADQLKQWGGWLVQAPLMDISSTAARAVAASKNWSALSKLVGEPTAHYIQTHNLYQLADV